MQNTGSFLNGFKKGVYPWIKRFIFGFIALMFILNLGFLSPKTVHAAADLTITPITWNVIGLDSNNVNVGPDTFPVGARVCNTGDAVTDDLVATFVWDSTAVAPDVDYINLRNGSLNSITLPGLSAGTPSIPSCFDFYFEVTVTRDPAAYNTSRFYHIEVESAASTPEFTSLSTPTPRELYIEYLISQNRNSTDNVSYALFTDPATPLVDVPPGGTMSLVVGNTYAIKLDASTATQGYNQLEAFINFPNTIFQVLSVDSTYTADSSGYVANTSDKLYADACYWDMDPTSETYLSCIGSDGKVGGTISTTYIVKIISIGDAGFNTLNTLIYDFSGSSFHYNSDFSSSSRVVSISSSLSMTKAFSPTAINAGGISTMSISITNTGDIDMTDVDMTDVLPTGLIVASSPNASAPEPNCISPTFSPAAEATSVTYTGGVAANSTCVISVDVTAASNGTYVNTTNPLLINDVNTGITATANLQVEDIPSSGVCASPVTIAQWTIPDTTAPPIATTNNSGGTAVAFTNSSDHSVTLPFWRIDDAPVESNPLDIATDKYFGFQVDTSDFTDVKMSFDYIRGNSGPAYLDVYYGSSGTISTIDPINPILLTGAHFTPSTTVQSSGNLDFTGKTNTDGETFFFLYTYYVANESQNWVGVDSITFTGCRTTEEIDKVFSSNPISTGDTSTLTFTLKNYAVTDAVNVAFSDTFPAGMEVATTAAASQCGGTVTAAAGSSEISLTGGTIPGKTTGEFGSCTVSVEVITSEAGMFPNTSGYLSVNGSVVNSFASDTLIVLDPPSITKAFSPNPIYTGETSTLTFTITNPNPDTALTGVAFNDPFPTNLTVNSAPSSTQCGGTVTFDANSISLTGGTISGGGSCTVSVDVTASLVGEYDNTSGNVTSTNAGTGNTASDTLVVQTTHPGISILKEVATSSNGPWSAYLNVIPGGNVYYRLIVENTGDVPLTSINITDVTSPVNTAVETAIAECIWPDVLPVASGTQNPTATCITGPFTTVDGTNLNTAAAHGTYNGTEFDSSPSTAIYATTELVLEKTAVQDRFTQAGDLVNYTYTITNIGATLIGPLSIDLFDTNTPVVCTVDLTISDVGHDADRNFENGEYFTCSAAYTVTAFDVSVGSVTNTAYATVAPSIGGSVRTNMDRETVFSNKPDLIVTKTNNVGGYAMTGNQFNWTLKITNQGPLSAEFGSGSLIFSDQLQSGPTYQLTTINPSEIAGITCALDGSLLLTCSTTQAVSIGEKGGFFTVGISVTPSSTASLINIAQVDPNDEILEGDEGNNQGSDALNVVLDPNTYSDLAVTKTDGVSSIDASGTATTSYTIRVTNNGPDTVTNAVLKDTLGSGISATGVTCSAAASNQCVTTPILADLIGTDGINLPALANGAFYEITLTVDVTATNGSVTNTVTVTPPSGTIDSNLTNNTASDVDTINPVADLEVTKTDGTISIEASGTATTSYTIRVTNNGPSSVTNAVLKDTLGLGLSATNVTCSATASNQCVSNPVLADLIGTDGITLPALSNGAFYEITLAVDVTATNGSVTNTVTVTPPSGTIDSNLTNNTASDVDTINPSADLVITKSNEGDSINENGTTIYTIRVTNNGPSSVADAVLVDNLPIGLDATAVTCSTAADNQCSSNPVLADLISSGIIMPVLVDGQFYEIELTATVTASSGSITNSATVMMPNGISDPTPVNNTDSDPDTVIPDLPNADLEVTKSNGVNNVIVNSSTTYTIRVTNHGPDEVTGVILEDTLGLGLDATTVVCSSVINNQCSTDPNLSDLLSTGIILPTLASDQFYEVRLTAIVTATSGTITNNVSITVPEPVIDPEPGNNSDEDEDQVITEYKLYLPLIARIIPVTETWITAVGMEDLRLDSGNDFDYNDWLVNIGTTFNYTSSTKENVNSISFEFTPLARGASYDHEYKLNFPADTFANNAVVTIRIYNQDHQLIQTRTEMLNASVENTYQIFAKTSAVLPGKSNVVEGSAISSPQQYANVSIVFQNSTPFTFIPEETYDAHGSNLFYRTILHVLNTGEEITMGDIRTLVVPTNTWAWPEERIRIDLAYPNVSFIPGISPNFIFPNLWWNTPNQCVVDGLSCPNAPADLIYIK